MILSVFIKELLENQIFMIAFWTGIFILAVIIEVSTSELVSIWFAGGAVIALITAIIKIPFGFQVLVWVGVSLLLFLLSKLLFGKKLAPKHQRTNLDQLIGEEIEVLKKVNSRELGEAKIRDVVWSIQSDDEINEGEYAIIKDIKGNKLIVRKKDK